MKTVDIPLLVRSLTDVYAPEPAALDAGDTPHMLLAAMVRAVLDVHHHDLFSWDSANARAIETTDVTAAEFAICRTCGSIEREYFWCWTVRQLYVTLDNAYDPEPAPGTQAGTWQGWRDMAEAVQRARAAYPAPVATAVIRALNNPSYSLTFRTNLLDSVITCTQAVPVQAAKAEKG
jgi:hypothetical protein